MTKYIDAGVYARSNTYTGPGTIDGNCRRDAGNGEFVTGDFTSSNEDVVVLLGFKPRRIWLLNETDAVSFERVVGMAAANSIKSVLGGSLAVTLDTGSAITEQDGGSGNYNVTLPAATVGNSKKIIFAIEG